MRTRQKMNFIVSVIISLMLITFSSALAVDYAKPVALDKGAQAGFDKLKHAACRSATRRCDPGFIGLDQRWST